MIRYFTGMVCGISLYWLEMAIWYHWLDAIGSAALVLFLSQIFGLFFASKREIT